AANQRPTDYHAVNVVGFQGSTSRSATETFQVMADRSVALPSLLPTTAPTALAGSHARLQYQVMLPSDLQAAATFSYGLSGGRRNRVTLTATAAVIGGTGLNSVTPD